MSCDVPLCQRRLDEARALIDLVARDTSELKQRGLRRSLNDAIVEIGEATYFLVSPEEDK